MCCVYIKIFVTSSLHRIIKSTSLYKIVLSTKKIIEYKRYMWYNESLILVKAVMAHYTKSVSAPFCFGGDFLSLFDIFFDFGNDFMNDVKQVALSEVTEEVKDIMEEQLVIVVYSYDASEESMESRRYEDGGLLDRANMVSSFSPDFVLTVENVAPFQDKYEKKGKDLSDVVEEGDKKYRQPYARPFVAETENECISSGRIYKVLMSALRARGYKFKGD